MATRSIYTSGRLASRRALETPEGHTVEYGEDGAVIGLELMNVRWTLEREGTLKLTWPRAELSAKQLDPVVAPA